MDHPKRIAATVLSLLLLLNLIPSLQAQSEEAVQIRLSRNLGLGFGVLIQGTFTVQANGPENLTRVVFLIDDEIIGEDTHPPYRMQFHTDQFPAGIHVLHAVGITSDGRELPSNSLQRQFLNGATATKLAAVLVTAMLILTVGGRMAASRIAGRGQSRKLTAFTGPFGGTLCPNCDRPFALHFWGLNLVIGKLDRCPHCGKWNLVRRAHPDALRAAAEAADQEAITANPGTAGDKSEEQSLRSQLDESRYVDDPPH
ncbi:MAG: Ig-like domain-containing protein [Anaerolineae bacterium]